MTQSSFFGSSLKGNTPISPFCNTVPYSGVILSLNNSSDCVQFPEKNFAFLDIQNLYQGIKERGWRIHWPSFRQYLHRKYNVVKAIVFIGFIKGNEWLYALLQNAGFELEFRATRILNNGHLDNGNCDCDLVSYVMDTKNEYTKAILIGDDSDYASAIQRLNRQNKLKLIISSHLLENTSQQIKRLVPPDMIISIHKLRNQISLR